MYTCTNDNTIQLIQLIADDNPCIIGIEMPSVMIKFALILIVLSVILIQQLCAAQEHNEKTKSSPSDYDYEIYELIDRLNKLKPEHSTLYDLLEVKPSATSEELSRKFRRLSFPFHPDKTQGNLEAKKMFTLYSGASQVLKVPESRKRYEWILNEAPPWHRSQVYLIRQLQKKRGNGNSRRSMGKKEISIVGLLSFMVIFLTVSQLLVQWVLFFLNRYWIWSGNKALKTIPIQELRRMEKKAQRSDLTFLANVDANYENMQAARSVPMACPKPTDLFILKWPIDLIKFIFSKIFGSFSSAPTPVSTSNNSVSNSVPASLSTSIKNKNKAKNLSAMKLKLKQK